MVRNDGRGTAAVRREWRPFSRPIRLQIIARDKSPEGLPWCAKCHATGVRFELNHKIMMAYDTRQKRLTADDGEMLCVRCHRRETKMQAAELARIRALRENQPTKKAIGETEIQRRFR